MVLGKQTKINTDLSKVEVGEIDTSSPFESVRHAVSLFGAVAFTRKRTQPSAKKTEPHSSEKVSIKESKLHLAEKELNKLKENISKAELTRSQALTELSKAKKTIKELNKELSIVSKSKDGVVKETDKLNDIIQNVQDKNSGNNSDWTPSSWKQDTDIFRVKYLAAALELNAAKLELGKLRLDYDSASRSYNSVLRQSSEAEAAVKANSEAAVELSGHISGMKELIEQAKRASQKAEEEKASVEASGQILGHEYQIKLNESGKTLQNLKKELDPERNMNLQKQLEIIADQSEAMKQDIHKAKDSYSELARILTLELDNAKAMLQNLIDEDSTLRCLIESLKLELENVKKELLELKEKEAEAKHLAEDLEGELQKSKSELEACMSDESKVSSPCDEMTSTLVGLLNQTQRAMQEAKDVTLEAEAIMKEAEANKNSVKEYEARLQLLQLEVEAARSAEAKALEEIKHLSERKDCGAKITLSKEEFNSLSVKIKDSATIADMKVSVAMVQVEAVKSRQNDCWKMLEASEKELETIKLTTAEALRMAGEMDADKNALEGEVVRLGGFLNNIVGDSKIDWEIEMEPVSSYPDGISRSYSTTSATRRRVTLGDILKLEREKSKRAPMRSLSGIFHRM